MNSILDLTIKENFINWLFFSSFVTLVVCLVISGIIKSFYYKKALAEKEVLMKYKELTKGAYLPDIYLNSVFKIIVSNTCILAVLVINQGLRILFGWGVVLDITLILLTVISIKVNNIIDNKWVDKKWLRSINGDESYAEENFPLESLRLLSSLFVLAILFISWLCFKIISFESFSMMLVLVLGRFIFFDTLVKNVKENLYGIRKVWKSALGAFFLICIFMGSAIHFGVLSYSYTPVFLFGIHVFYLIGFNYLYGRVFLDSFYN